MPREPKKTINVLIGETIVSVEVTRINRAQGDFVDEAYKITTESGKVFYFAVDGGDHPHFGKLREVTINDLIIEDEDENEIVPEFVIMGSKDFVGVWVDPRTSSDGGHRILL